MRGFWFILKLFTRRTPPQYTCSPQILVNGSDCSFQSYLAYLNDFIAPINGHTEALPVKPTLDKRPQSGGVFCGAGRIPFPRTSLFSNLASLRQVLDRSEDIQQAWDALKWSNYMSSPFAHLTNFNSISDVSHRYDMQGVSRSSVATLTFYTKHVYSWRDRCSNDGKRYLCSPPKARRGNIYELHHKRTRNKMHSIICESSYERRCLLDEVVASSVGPLRKWEVCVHRHR